MPLVEDRTVADVVLEVAGFDAWYRFNNGGARRLFPEERRKIAAVLGVDPGVTRVAHADLMPVPTTAQVLADALSGTGEDLREVASASPDLVRGLVALGVVLIVIRVTR